MDTVRVTLGGLQDDSCWTPGISVSGVCALGISKRSGDYVAMQVDTQGAVFVSPEQLQAMEDRIVQRVIAALNPKQVLAWKDLGL